MIFDKIDNVRDVGVICHYLGKLDVVRSNESANL
jgi:hypothetical protein